MKFSTLRGAATGMLLLCWTFALCCFTIIQASENDTVVNIGVILERGNELENMGYNCMKMALSEFYKSNGNYKTRMDLHPMLYNPNDSIVEAASAALYLLKYKEVKAIIGPTTSKDAEFVIRLGQKAHVPILSYSATSPYVSSGQCSYFISMAEDYSVQVKAISAIVQKFGWKHVVPIYDDTSVCGVGLLPYLDDALRQINVIIPLPGAISSTATDDQISRLLQKLKNLETRVFVVDVSPELASRLFRQANKFGMTGKGSVWITTTRISNEIGSLDDNVTESMLGVVGVQTYVPETDELILFKRRWESEYGDIKLNVMGYWAYNAACALARAVERVASQNTAFKNTQMSGNLITDLDNFEVSLVGPELLKALQTTNFNGLAGNFRIADGQLSSSPMYKIINLCDRGKTGIQGVGFWISEKGLQPGQPRLNSQRNSSLQPITWPGDTRSTPKGWKMLQVAVPVNEAYQQLVNATPNSKLVTGFCIDIFESVMKNLGYQYNYTAQPKQNGVTDDLYYDNLVKGVFDQDYDILVGDISIISSRTEFVDFTLPFTESGLVMVVPIRDDKQSAWVFLKPLTWQLWVATLCAFLLIAFTIWVLEHRNNRDFGGTPLQQAGTSLFYSFSMMVFAHKENVSSNLSRCVVVVWVFVVLIITQSYTASLTSMLTVQRLKPAVTDIHELQTTGALVGVQTGTFVKEFLVRLGFHRSNIRSYKTCEDLDDMFLKGPEKGRIAAVFDEMPYMKIYLTNRSSQYMMIPPIYKNDGFGFAFPKDSPLVSEVSREILCVTQGANASNLEVKWGMQQSDSPKPGNITSTNQLTLHSFLGLFLIVGIATGFSLLVVFVQFLYKRRGIWTVSDASVGNRTRKLTKAPSQNQDTNTQNAIPGQTLTIETELLKVPRPSNYSDSTEENWTDSE